MINYYVTDYPVVQPRHHVQPCHATRKRNLRTIYFFVFRHEEDAEECLSIYAHRVITVTRVRGRRPRNEAHSIRGPENRITRHTSNFECSFNRQLVAMCLPRFYFERQYCMLEFASIRQEEHALQSTMSEFRYELDDNVLLKQCNLGIFLYFSLQDSRKNTVFSGRYSLNFFIRCRSTFRRLRKIAKSGY